MAPYRAAPSERASSLPGRAEAPACRARLRVTNQGAGQHAPTCVTPAIVLRVVQVDRTGRPLPRTAREARVRRDVAFDGGAWIERSDARLAAGATTAVAYDLPRHPRARGLRAPGAARRDARGPIGQASKDRTGSRFTAWETTAPLTPARRDAARRPRWPGPLHGGTIHSSASRTRDVPHVRVAGPGFRAPGLQPGRRGSVPIRTEGFALADWRRTVAELYGRVRAAAGGDEAAKRRAVAAFRDARNRLFEQHPCSPLEAGAREGFRGLSYYAYEPRWQVTGLADFAVEQYEWRVPLPEGAMRCTRIATVTFRLGTAAASLDVFWVEGYGGGLFLPFRDGTTGEATYGGGRYLYDSIKGADLGTSGSVMNLDFNYAYNPSCAYSDRWVCPLAPRRNTVPVKVTAGEKTFLR